VDKQQRKSHGIDELKKLISRYGKAIGPSSLLEQAEPEWTLFREKLLLDFAQCRGAAEVCQRVIRSTGHSTCFPVLTQLARIALTIPLSTAWPERGFSAMKRIKSCQRNRMADNMMFGLLNVAMNGPAELSDEDAEKIAVLWKEGKKRRRVFCRKVTDDSQSCQQSNDGDDLDLDDQNNMEECDDFETMDDMDNFQY
jgi:hypothetical protein